MARDDDGLLTGRDVAGGLDATWTRDPGTGRASSFSEDLGGTVTATGLTYDAAGRVLTETAAAGTTTYDYDDAGQLLGADRPGTTDDETYAYDELGRRTVGTLGATSTSYVWDAASQLTGRTIGGSVHTYTYDASGRRTRESWNGGATYRQWGYSSRGFLNTIRSVSPSGTDETTRYLRGDGTILSSTTTPAGGTSATSLFAWDTTQTVPQAVWIRTESNHVTATFADGLARLQCTSTTLDCEGPVAHDALGSALATPDTDDTVAADGYTAFGDPGGADLGPRFGFRSEVHTAGLIHLRARDYDPETGTFLRTDPLDGVDGTTTVANPYHYGDNDPVNQVDPTGLRPTDDDIEIDENRTYPVRPVRPPTAPPGGRPGPGLIMPALIAIGIPMAVAEILHSETVAIDIDGGWYLSEESKKFVNAPQTAQRRRMRNQTVYRVYGGCSQKWGTSWTPIPPWTFQYGATFAFFAGLPSCNTMEMMVEAKLMNPTIVAKVQQAKPIREGAYLGGNNYQEYYVHGGLLEYIIPNAQLHARTGELLEIANYAIDDSW